MFLKHPYTRETCQHYRIDKIITWLFLFFRPLFFAQSSQLHLLFTKASTFQSIEINNSLTHACSCVKWHLGSSRIKTSNQIIIYGRGNICNHGHEYIRQLFFLYFHSFLCSINRFDKVNRQSLFDLSDRLRQTATISISIYRWSRCTSFVFNII